MHNSSTYSFFISIEDIPLFSTLSIQQIIHSVKNTATVHDIGILQWQHAAVLL